MADASISSSRTKSSGKSKQKNGTPTTQTSRLVSQKWVFSGVILLLGGAASAAFLAVGIVSTLNESQEQFIHEAQEWSHAVHSTLRDYELLSLWTHESCSKLDPSKSQRVGHCARGRCGGTLGFLLAPGISQSL